MEEESELYVWKVFKMDDDRVDPEFYTIKKRALTALYDNNQDAYAYWLESLPNDVEIWPDHLYEFLPAEEQKPELNVVQLPANLFTGPWIAKKYLCVGIENG
jgi:hypothetical protein